MKDVHIEQLLTPVLAEHGLELEAVEIVPAGKRRLLRLVVDGDGPEGTGPLLDDIAEATKAVSATLDADDAAGAAPYTLEVTSRGVSRPLTLPRHWRRNAGRLVRVNNADGTEITGRITEVEDDQVLLATESEQISVRFADIGKALVQVELNRAEED
ncbi:ribosome maturation factor RimP [Microlunatus sp. GCM10028923]|uniref:ribosome maturation factor RimP n=1 Tax=Microlunatus sp. GCM10028923 TaxID=3273400 RepID=UPI003613EFF4